MSTKTHRQSEREQQIAERAERWRALRDARDDAAGHDADAEGPVVEDAGGVDGEADPLDLPVADPAPSAGAAAACHEAAPAGAEPLRDGAGVWSAAPIWLGRVLAGIALAVEVVIRAVVFVGRILGIAPGEKKKRFNVTRIREEAAERERVRHDEIEQRPVVHLVVNPISGEGRARAVLPELRRGLRKRGFACDVLITQKAGDAIEYLERELPRDATDPARIERGHGDTHAVISVGGDGTLGEVVVGVRRAGLRTPVALYAAGTVNCLSNELGIPRDVEKFCDMIAWGRTVDLDLGEVRCADRPGLEQPNSCRLFHSFIGVGFDALVLEEMGRRRTGNIWQSNYTIPIYESLRNYSFPPLEVTADGETIAEHGGMAVVSNIKSYAHMEVAPEASPLDGKLDVHVVKRRSVLGHVRAIWHAVRHDNRRFMAEVVGRKTTQVTIESPAERVPVQIDGDHVGFLPARVQMLEGAIALVVPPGPIGELRPPTPSSGEIARPEAITARIKDLAGQAADAGRRAARKALDGDDPVVDPAH